MCLPFLHERLPPAGHYRAGYNAIDLYTILDALFGKSLRKRDDGRINRSAAVARPIPWLAPVTIATDSGMFDSPFVWPLAISCDGLGFQYREGSGPSSC
jgi:hypothetical protein